MLRYGPHALGCMALWASACGARTGLDAGKGGEASEAPSAPVPCVSGDTELHRAVPALMFVIDASGSMGFDLGDSQVSRWSALNDALNATLPPVDKTMQIGALVYPSNTGGAGHDQMSCIVPGQPQLLPATGHVASFVALMNESSPDGATPTANAVTTAAKSLLSVRAASTARAMVLATDGGPNCNESLDAHTCECVQAGGCDSARMCLDDARTVEVIASYAAKGVPTYVIGIAANQDDVFSSVLDAMAVAGGRPKTGGAEHYYAATSPADLDDALSTIRNRVGSCVFLTTSVPDETGTITIFVDGAEVPIDETGTTGWNWGDRNNGEVIFSGPTCAAISSGDHAITATVTCGS